MQRTGGSWAVKCTRRPGRSMRPLAVDRRAAPAEATDGWIGAGHLWGCSVHSQPTMRQVLCAKWRSKRDTGGLKGIYGDRLYSKSTGQSLKGFNQGRTQSYLSSENTTLPLLPPPMQVSRSLYCSTVPWYSNCLFSCLD